MQGIMREVAGHRASATPCQFAQNSEDRHLSASSRATGFPMTDRPTVAFAKFAAPKKGSVIVLAPEGGELGEHARACDPAGIMPRVFAAADFKGKLAASVEALAPQGTEYDRLAAVGTGKPDALDEQAWLRIGGAAAAAAKKAAEVTLVAEVAGRELTARDLAVIGLGILMRAYVFDKYKTRKDD